MNKRDPHAMGHDGIGKLLLEYSIPAIISMTVVSLYNVIDSVFIGHGVGAIALSGLAVTFPLMNLTAAFCTLVGSGTATICSIRLGQKDVAGAIHVVGNALSLSIITSIIFGAFSLLFLDNILLFFGASKSTLPYAREYMEVILLGTPITYIMIGLNNTMRATGYPQRAMYSSFLTVGTNIITTPLFILSFGWGIRGAAFATVLSQLVGMIWALLHFMNPKSYVHFKSGTFKIRKRILKSIFSIGMAPFLMNACACVVVIFINGTLLSKGGDLAIGAYGIINRVLTMFAMIVMGLTMGMQPIIGYNFGADQLDRVNKTLRLGILAGIAVTSLGFILAEVFPEAISMLFTNEEELLKLSANGLQSTAMMFAFVGGSIVISNYFQAIGMAKTSIVLSLSRQLLYLIPLLIIMPRIWGTNGVWYSMATSDLLSIITAALALLWHKKTAQKKAEYN